MISGVPSKTPILDAANIAGMSGDHIAYARVLVPKEPTPAMLDAMVSVFYGPNRVAMREVIHNAYQAQPVWQELWVELMEQNG